MDRREASTDVFEREAASSERSESLSHEKRTLLPFRPGARGRGGNPCRENRKARTPNIDRDKHRGPGRQGRVCVQFEVSYRTKGTLPSFTKKRVRIYMGASFISQQQKQNLCGLPFSPPP